MWRETNVLGILISPLLVYALAALLLWLPLRYLLMRLRADRWLDNPAVLHLALYLVLLAGLVTWL